MAPGTAGRASGDTVARHHLGEERAWNRDNPYAAPEAPLIEPTRPAAVGAWTVGQLRLLAALSAAAVLGTLVMSVLLLTIDPLLHPALTRLGEWMGRWWRCSAATC